MPRKLRTRVLGIAIVSACGFTATNIERDDGALSPNDSSSDAYIADASLCVAASKECIGSNQKLRVCDSTGASSRDIDCPWSCLDTPEPHCAELVPSGGALTSADLDSTALADQTITSVTINTDDGSISGNVRSAGPGIINGIDYTQRGNVGVFRFGKLTINGVVNIRGTRAAAIVSINEITVNGEINAQGDCNNRNAGPGGGSGGSDARDGSGSGSGGAGSGSSSCSGGGGAGHGGSGGDGGGRNNGGNPFGLPTIAQLVGGGGGGGGGGDSNEGGDGGGGGGALQLAANKRIKINGVQPFAGGINAGGCGGRGGICGGGGGGAGGAILIEAPVIEFASSALAVNGGGGGGGGAGNSTGESGDRADLSASKPSGGQGADGSGGGKGPQIPDGGDGGDGGDDGGANGNNGQNASRAGGGGGAVGRMRFNTLSGSIVTSGTVIFSPALSTMTTQTTTSRGMAVIK